MGDEIHEVMVSWWHICWRRGPRRTLWTKHVTLGLTVRRVEVFGWRIQWWLCPSRHRDHAQ